jgi:D-sedoheptulose 7-phosphate isomerase
MPAQYFETHFREHQQVVGDCIASLQPASDAATEALIACIGRGGKILAFGNGGSATQASHFVEELLGRFKETRRPLYLWSVTPASLRASPTTSAMERCSSDRYRGSRRAATLWWE